jgi:hypothetical protein
MKRLEDTGENDCRPDCRHHFAAAFSGKTNLGFSRALNTELKSVDVWPEVNRERISFDYQNGYYMTAEAFSTEKGLAYIVI